MPEASDLFEAITVLSSGRNIFLQYSEPLSNSHPAAHLPGKLFRQRFSLQSSLREHYLLLVVNPVVSPTSCSIK